SAGVGGFFNTKASQRQRASRAGKYANERNSEVQFAYNKSNGELSGEIARIKADPTIVDKDKAEKEATILSATKMVKNTSSDATSRQALMVAAAQSGDTTTLRALQSVMTGQEWDAGVANNYSAFDGVAQYRAYDPSYKTSIDIDDTSIGTGTKLAAEGLKGGDLTKLSGGAQKDIVTQKAAVPLQSFIDAHAGIPESTIKPNRPSKCRRTKSNRCLG
ncbi:MAG: hypothetical protein NTY56_01700, partial [Patescibacteria group bacterium]|nr:hypothetical protein [Patescibacteria group bacterium]